MADRALFMRTLAMAAKACGTEVKEQLDAKLQQDVGIDLHQFYCGVRLCTRPWLGQYQQALGYSIKESQ